uniref:hypothetical protein n=1 Tax=Megasphaera elsdenii TaxID=907 RepID=UPI00242DC9DC
MAKAKTVLDNQFMNSGKFIMLAILQKLLYIYLLIYADDDGIVDVIMPMRACDAKQSDLEMLIQKHFVIVLQGSLVFLPDYALHNKNMDIRYKKDSNFLPLLAKKLPQAIIIVATLSSKGTKKKVTTTVGEYIKTLAASDNVYALPAGKQKTAQAQEVTVKTQGLTVKTQGATVKTQGATVKT